MLTQSEIYGDATDLRGGSASHTQSHLDFYNDSDTIDIMLFDNGCVRFDFDSELKRAIGNSEAAALAVYRRGE